MGYSAQDLFGTAREARAEYDMVDADDCSSPVVAMLSKLENELKSEPAVEDFFVSFGGKRMFPRRRNRR